VYKGSTRRLQICTTPIQTPRSGWSAGCLSSDQKNTVIFTENFTCFLQPFCSEADFPFRLLFEAGFSPIRIKPCWIRVPAPKIAFAKAPEIAFYVLFLTAENFAELRCGFFEKNFEIGIAFSKTPSYNSLNAVTTCNKLYRRDVTSPAVFTDRQWA
jgi:hypothetical protein